MKRNKVLLQVIPADNESYDDIYTRSGVGLGEQVSLRKQSRETLGFDIEVGDFPAFREKARPPDDAYLLIDPAWLFAPVLRDAFAAVISTGIAAGAYNILKTWVDARNGRKLKIKVGDIEVEATQMKEADVLRIFELL